MSYNTQCLINNVFRILPNIKNLAVVDGTVTEFWANDPATLVKEPANPRKRRKVAGATDQEGPEPVDPVQRSSEHTKTFENLWVAYLGLPLSLDLYKQILLLMHKRIIPYMHYPPALSDFLTRAYAQGGVVSVLALNSLFTLMQEHNLTYADFYLKLYALFDRQLFHVKYRSRFLRMASLFLASTHLPSYIIAAFAKRMARLALDAPPAALLVVLPWIYNLLKAHASCMPLIHRTDAKAKPKSTPTVNKWMASDPYDHTAADPKEAKALESSLWEIQTLQSHYAPQVSTMAKVFSDRFTRNPFDLEDFLDHTYSTLFSAELDRPSHKDPALAAQIPPRLFIEGDTYHDLWDLS
ncbi:CBF/Mak21 family-domain-containing protein [Dimargaris cristalligena]|uniref:CBF/Mak21 family-domain-containing protein n=1 Tax=Dimargaris cristalligena TaxID=215637 RepID=A0A4V1J421_9FUNG|nr:CBF/Mak21 family-domain-containing protein [Dimargaris cristalligena]|eukprot:RKP34039.1 CBF/Mak21 family-domain-containing protein [Dimargaris cristalligena]